MIRRSAQVDAAVCRTSLSGLRERAETQQACLMAVVLLAFLVDQQRVVMLYKENIKKSRTITLIRGVLSTEGFLLSKKGGFFSIFLFNRFGDAYSDYLQLNYILLKHTHTHTRNPRNPPPLKPEMA